MIFPEGLDESYFQKHILMHLVKSETAEATEHLAETFKTNNHIYTTRHDELPEIWIYSEGIYIPQGKTHIREYMRKILGEAYKERLTNEVIAKITADTYIEVQDFFNNNIVEEIVCQNGLLDLRTGELKPYNPLQIHFTKIPIEYKPEAKCPSIEEFFKDILETPEDVATMFELFGYCLWKDSFMEMAVMFVGEGRNGKSKTLELLRRFLGEENTKAIPLQKLEEDNFAECELFGKLANLAGDLSDKPLDHTGKFKSITGRDSLSASRKFKTKIDFVAYAKAIFATNKLPKVRDTTVAFWERWVYFRFPYTFEPTDTIEKLKECLKPEDLAKYKPRNPEIIKRLTTSEELSGLLNKSIEGLHKMLALRQFTKSQSADDIMKMWIRASDSFLAFCMECLQQDPESVVPKQQLRIAYQHYCKRNKSLMEGDKHIKFVLARQFGAVEGRKVFEDWKGQEHVWEGISLKNELLS